MNFECNQYKKDETSPAVFRQIFNHLINRYAADEIIFTDGSKSAEGVGAAFVSGSSVGKYHLNDQTSIFVAEIIAIQRALDYLENKPSGLFLICSDSQSALLALLNTCTMDPLIRNTLKKHHDLHEENKRIVFIWTPGHAGIAGNEKADLAAKSAVQQLLEDFPTYHEDMRRTIKQKIKETWQNEWNNTQNHLQRIQPLIGDYQYLSTLTRREQVVLTRLRIGHTNLTKIHLLLGESPPFCQQCQALITVEHIVTECVTYTATRLKHRLANTLPRCLSGKTEIYNLMNFLREIQLFGKI